MQELQKSIKNKIEPREPVDKDLYELPPDEAADIPQVPGSLPEVLDALEAGLRQRDIPPKQQKEEVSPKQAPQGQAGPPGAAGSRPRRGPAAAGGTGSTHMLGGLARSVRREPQQGLADIGRGPPARLAPPDVVWHTGQRQPDGLQQWRVVPPQASSGQEWRAFA